MNKSMNNSKSKKVVRKKVPLKKSCRQASNKSKKSKVKKLIKLSKKKK